MNSGRCMYVCISDVIGTLSKLDAELGHDTLSDLLLRMSQIKSWISQEGTTCLQLIDFWIEQCPENKLY